MSNESPPGTTPAQPLATGAKAAEDQRHLFVVERRLPGITEGGLVMLQAALTAASARFAARGEEVTYLRSTFMPGEERLVSLFSAVSLELVRAASEASLVPYLSIERAFDLPDDANESTAE
jgi:hypothetical protein